MQQLMHDIYIELSISCIQRQRKKYDERAT